MTHIVWGNPVGLWAFCAVPVILLIHLIQQRSVPVSVSTLFLLEQLSPESVRGRQLDMIRNSLPLWLQLLAACLLTFLISDPRLISPNSVQRVILVLDSSASMHAFKEQALQKLQHTLPQYTKLAAKTEFILLETNPNKGILYDGSSPNELLDKARIWAPTLGQHDYTYAFDIAKRFADNEGFLVFITDRRHEVPTPIEQLGVGRVIANCGFTGGRVSGRVEAERETPQFEALIKNYATVPQQRAWWVDFGTSKSIRNEVSLEPGEIITVRGNLPPEVKEFILVLSGDEFVLDDALPLRKPVSKELDVYIEPGSPFQAFYKRFFSSLRDAKRVSSQAEATLRIHTQTPSPAAQDTLDTEKSIAKIIFLRDQSEAKKLSRSAVVADYATQTADLTWDSLITATSSTSLVTADDQVLLWQGTNPLIAERSHAGKRDLLINFDLLSSNAERHASFIVLLHRFAELVRLRKATYSAQNVETHQHLPLSANATGSPLHVSVTPVTLTPKQQYEIAPQEVNHLRAPEEPSFFEIRQGDFQLFSGASQFTHVTEADFKKAETFDDVSNEQAKYILKNTMYDPFTPLWLIMLCGLVLWSWVVEPPVGRKR